MNGKNILLLHNRAILLLSFRLNGMLLVNLTFFLAILVVKTEF